MTITQLARFSQQKDYAKTMETTPQLPNGSLPPPGHVNPYGEEGMGLTGRTDYRHMIPVDEGVVNQIKDYLYTSMIENGGMGTGEGKTAKIINAYVMTLPPEDRAAAGWTLNQIKVQEANRIAQYVDERVPGWHTGMPVDPEVLKDFQWGLDIQA